MDCLACLLVGDTECNDCGTILCDACINPFIWEENDYSSDSDGVLTFDIELCKSCYEKYQ